MRRSDSQEPRLSVIVPAHNEEKRIRLTLQDFRNALPDAEICVVANNCTDRTVDLLREVCLEDPLLTYANIPVAVGKGGAVRAGFKLVRGDAIAFVDADGATSGAELRRLYELMGDADGVIASRWKKGARVETRQSLKRRVLSRGFNFIIRMLFGLPYLDTQCGAKIFRRSAIQQAMTLVETSDFSFDVDLLYQLRRLDKRVVEAPSRWSDRAGSSVDVKKAVPRMFASMLRLRLKYSPLRALVPVIDRVAKLRPISAKTSFNVLVCSDYGPRDARASAMERAFFALCAELHGKGFLFTWCAASERGGAGRIPNAVDEVSMGSRKFAKVTLPVVYLAGLRDRFDCVIELCPSGRPWWTPLFSLKTKLVFAPLLDRLPALYGATPLINAMPATPAALAEHIESAVIREGPRFCAQADGSWVLLDRGTDSLTQRLPLSTIGVRVREASGALERV